ncbi:MAG: hypothetical protein P8R54_05210 [Myxococcota bacterium]|nr:hypothetical protein [Myxococcota bacterium]
MIVVTGTKRSGTSMWMQLLAAAGLPVIGDRFPRRFIGLKEGNPEGFYESRLRGGIYHATNPDPQTGSYLHSDDTTRHVVKVFIPGLIRTDSAFLDRVIATVRPWREYVTSMQRLRSLEARAKDSPSTPTARPPELEWWQEMYALIGNASIRRLPLHLVTYEQLLRDPEGELTGALEWLGGGDLSAAIAAIQPDLRTQHHPEITSDVLDANAISVLDDLYDAIHRDRMLSPSLLQRMNVLHTRLQRDRVPTPKPGQ